MRARTIAHRETCSGAFVSQSRPRAVGITLLVACAVLSVSPLLARSWARTIEEDRAASERKPADEATASVAVQPTLPDGAPAHLAYVTLWRALGPGEKDPINRVNGPKDFGYYNPVIWDDKQHKARWVCESHAHPNDGQHGWKEDVFRFTRLPAGQYRVTVVSYRSEDDVPDPTPYGASEPFTLGAKAAKPEATIAVRMRGSSPLVVRLIDADSREPIPAAALRLRDADGMPIVHGHGSGNYFERTSERGEVRYRHLQPGEFTVEVLGKQAQVNQFIDYSPPGLWMAARASADSTSVVEIPVRARKLDPVEIKQRFPFYVLGRVTDEQGKPVEDVEVRAATGVATLIGGGTTRTNADGRYRLYFGPGMLGIDTQAALISARKAGWYETSLNRQGNLLMSTEEPSAIAAEIKKRGRVWDRASVEQVVFPNTPREVNFTLAKSAVITGKLISSDAGELKNQYLCLTGEDLPPGHSVLEAVTTGRDGEFRIDGVPPKKPWRFSMRVAGTFEDIETNRFIFADSGEYRCEVRLESKRSGKGAVTLSLRYHSVGAVMMGRPGTRAQAGPATVRP